MFCNVDSDQIAWLSVKEVICHNRRKGKAIELKDVKWTLFKHINSIPFSDITTEGFDKNLLSEIERLTSDTDLENMNRCNENTSETITFIDTTTKTY